MTRFLFEAYPRGADANNAPMSGAKMYVYEAGTTTPVTVYSDIANTIPHAHPIVADASGVWPQIYLPNGTYKVVIASAADVVIQTIDNVYQIDDAGETVVDDTAALIADTSLYYGAGLGGVAEGDYVRTRTGRLFIVADENATDAHAETAGGVKLYETGFSYSSIDNFEAAIDRGDFSGVWNGSPVEVAGTTYVKDDRQTFIPGLPGWRYPWQVQKHLLSADWQPRVEATSPGEAARFKAVLDSIAARHPDLTHAHVLGDLVTVGSVDTTGAAPEYGFPEFLADWRARLPIPLHNAYFIPGNHDRDGTDIGSFKAAWTMQSYRRWMGREFYATVQGNLMFIYMGDMGGSIAGAITDAVVAWFGDLVRRNKDKNIFVCLHHPLAGTYNGNVDPSDTTQRGSSRISDILTEVSGDADNICAVFYGHVGSANQFNDETAYGTRHLQIGMHIPSNVDNARNDQYYVMEMEHGASSIGITQWDATADTELTTKTVALTYPLQLGPEVVRLDGPSTTAPMVAVPVDDYVEDLGGGVFGVPEGTKIPLLDLRTEDRANTANPDHLEAGLRFGWGLVNTGGDHDGAASSPAHEDAAWLTIARLSGAGTGDAPTLSWGFRAMKDGVLTDNFWSDDAGLHVGHNGSATASPATAQVDGVTTNMTGFVSAYRTNGVAGFFGRSNTGNLINFYNGSSLAGEIEITGASTVSYNTTSDERLKTDLRDFDGMAVIRALAVYDHAWKAGGPRSRGVMAQAAHEVAPYAVSVGGDDPAKEPWGVDLSKLVPDLIRAVQQLEERIKELEG